MNVDLSRILCRKGIWPKGAAVIAQTNVIIVHERKSHFAIYLKKRLVKAGFGSMLIMMSDAEVELEKRVAITNNSICKILISILF